MQIPQERGRPTPKASSVGRRESTDSRKPRKLLEIWFAFLDVGVPPLLRLFREVVEKRCIAGEVEQSNLAVAIGVESELHRAQCHRRELQHFPTPLDRFRFE